MNGSLKMPYPKREPVPESEMEFDPVSSSEMKWGWEKGRKEWRGHHNICQTLRDMYHETDDPNIKLKCRICVAMAKAMNKKLQYYKDKEQGII